VGSEKGINNAIHRAMAMQGHPRSMTSAPIKSAFVLWINSKPWCYLASIWRQGDLKAENHQCSLLQSHLTLLLRLNPLKFLDERYIVTTKGKDFVILACIISTQYQ